MPAEPPTQRSVKAAGAEAPGLALRACPAKVPEGVLSGTSTWSPA